MAREAARTLLRLAIFSLLAVAYADLAENEAKDLVPAAIAFLGKDNYIVTTGTWGYSQFSNNGHPNGNANGQGDYDYPLKNQGYLAATLFDGLYKYGPQLSAATVQGTSTEMPVTRYVGVAAAHFPSNRLGVAVGSAGTFQANGVQYTGLSILLSIDGGLSWMRASGVPRLNQLDTPTDTFAFGSAIAPLKPPWPIETSNDLTDVFFPSRTTGYAVGGNDVTLSTVVSTGEALSFGNTAAAAGVYIAMGAVFMSTNGGTVWRNVPIFPSRATAVTAWVANNAAVIKTIYAAWFPGILFGIHGTSNGKYLYAVGSPGSRYYADAAMTNPIVDNTAAAASVKVDTNPTILFSSNGGVSWTAQKGPFRGGARLTLFDVSVEKGSTAVACGGHPTVNFGAKSNGAIILTTNGGFTWRQVYPTTTTSQTTPTLNCVTHQPAIAGVSRVWVGGYVTVTDAQRTVTAPSAATLPQTGFFPTAAQVSDGFAAPRTEGLIHTVLLSLDNGQTFSPAPFQIFPRDFVQRAFSYNTPTRTDPYLIDRTVYGIAWENSARGWIYGNGFILGTSNFGITWTYETPPDVAGLSNPKVKIMAVLPTSH